MQKTLFAILALVPALAHADPAAQLAKDLDSHWSYWETYRDDPGSRAGSLGHDPTPEACEAAVAKARSAGLENDARIHSTSSQFRGIDEVSYDEKKQAYLLLSEIDQMCKDWKGGVQLAPVAAMMTELVGAQASYSQVDPISLGKGMGEVFVKEGKACLELADKAMAGGAPADRKVKIKDQVMTIREGRTKVCQAYLDWANSLSGKVTAAHSEDREKRAAPYKAAGIAGAKLALFVEYDDVYWRGGANCQRISDVKQLAKARALFQWLENPDGTHTIRRYTFNGNKVSTPVNKTYRNAAAAQRGCK